MTPRTSRVHVLHSGLPHVRQYATAGTSTWLAQFIWFSYSAGPVGSFAHLPPGSLPALAGLRRGCSFGTYGLALAGLNYPSSDSSACSPPVSRASRRGANRAHETRSRKPVGCFRNIAPRAPALSSTSFPVPSHLCPHALGR